MDEMVNVGGVVRAPADDGGDGLGKRVVNAMMSDGVR